MSDLWEGLSIALVSAVIIGGCSYNNHLRRTDRIEQMKIELEFKKLNGVSEEVAK